MKFNNSLFLSNSIIKTTLLNILVIVGFYLLFNMFAVYKLLDLADKELDKKIKHEIEHVDGFVDYKNDSLIFHTMIEFEEPDFQTITDNAYFLSIYDNKGKVLFESKNIRLLDSFNIKRLSLKNDIEFANEEHSGIDLRIIYKKMDSEDNVIIRLGTPRASTVNLAQEFESFILLTSPVVLILIVLSALFLSKKAYSNINSIIELAHQISSKNFGKRIEFDASKTDILGRLRDTLNNLFERLENQFNLISDFSKNASHQLMTPLTVLKSEIDFLLKKERSKDEYVSTLLVLQEQTDKMISITKSLLIIARESVETGENKISFSLNKLINETIRKLYDSRVKFELKGEIIIRGNAEHFALVIQNLLDNAIKYSPESEIVEFSAVETKEIVEIKVKDRGYGILENEKNFVFDKFYRGSNIKSKEGYGLGLSLSKSIIKQMSGKIFIEDTTSEGTTFIINLPSITDLK
ncbi:MAG: HAMP domain-containing histidine kinase [Ignavibacteriaceae bacterium]|nr:HAMP domain-containing histidine kinase [Ignavibacteriaceae bacterium]